jgi:rubrerythrin
LYAYGQKGKQLAETGDANVRITSVRANFCIRFESMNKTRTLRLFSLAEQASALEMLAAAKLSKHPDTVRGFISHATDEYRHARIFNNMVKNICSDQEIKAEPQSLLAVKTEKYVNTEEFLAERYSESEFAVFVAVHEALAVREFKALARRLDSVDDKIVLQNVIRDEEGHHASVLDDETRHAKLAGDWVVRRLGRKRHVLTVKHWVHAKIRKARGSIMPIIKPVFFLASVPLVLLALFLVRGLSGGQQNSDQPTVNDNM